MKSFAAVRAKAAHITPSTESYDSAVEGSPACPIRACGATSTQDWGVNERYGLISFFVNRGASVGKMVKYELRRFITVATSSEMAEGVKRCSY